MNIDKKIVQCFEDNQVNTLIKKQQQNVDNLKKKAIAKSKQQTKTT
jgi:Iap family predicted aminopeptidase